VYTIYPQNEEEINKILKYNAWRVIILGIL
jgi:hypothetical protein